MTAAASRAMRTLFVHGIGEIGGAERELVTITTELAKRGCESLVVCPASGSLQRELATRGIGTREGRFVAWRKWKGWLGRRAAVHSLEAILQAERPSLVHVNDIWWVPQTLRARRNLSIPLVAHVRQEIEPSKAARYELDRADMVIAVSKHVQRSLEEGGIAKERVRTIYSGIDLSLIPVDIDGTKVRRELGLSDDDFVLGTVANLFPRKGYEFMLEALPTILAEAPRTHYLIIGTGDHGYERQLRALVRRLSIDAHVHFLGFRPDVYTCLSALDVYVHPALMEGFGIAVLEAMAMKRPVVAASTGGPTEVLDEGRCGLLVPPRDPEALAQQVLRLRREPGLRATLGGMARRRVETLFDVVAMMTGLVRVHHESSTRVRSSD